MDIATTKVIHPQNLAINVLLSLFLVAIIACADKPTEPELTEEDVAHVVAEELAKMTDAEKEEGTALDWVTCVGRNGEGPSPIPQLSKPYQNRHSNNVPRCREMSAPVMVPTAAPAITSEM